jgi:hypothetical protein
MYTSQEGDLYLGQARALGAEGVLPKQIKQADVTKMLFQLRLVSDRSTREQSLFTVTDPAPNLVPANEPAIESSIVVEQPQVAPVASAAGDAAADEQFAQILPKMSLEIRAALDSTLQKEFAALRSFIGGTLDSQSERLQGDLATLLPASRTPALDLPTVMPERRSWGTFLALSLAIVAMAGGAFMSWMWWNQGSEIAALRTDLAAAYTELEALRAAPPVVSAPAPAIEPALVNPNVVDPNGVVPDVVDPNAVAPAADAPDAALATSPEVALVPTGAVNVAAPGVNNAQPAAPPAATAPQPPTTQAQ